MNLAAKSALVAAVAVCIVSCFGGDSAVMFISIVPGGRGGIPIWQRVGDTVRVYASEWVQGYEATEPVGPGSDRAPELFEWSSSNPTVAEVLPPGRLVMRAMGETRIGAKGPSAASYQRLVVCARNAELRILPRDPVLNIGETLEVEITLVSPGAGLCDSFAARSDPTTFGGAGAGPPLLEAISSTLERPRRFKAVRSGNNWYVTTMYFAQGYISDSIRVTVR